MSTEFTHIKIVPTAILLDGDFAKNADESIRQEKIARAAPELFEALKDIIALEGTEENEWDAVERLIPAMCEIARKAVYQATS